MKWVIAYDIRADSVRRRVANRLQQVGFRRQYSLFEGELSVSDLRSLLDEIGTLLDPSSDVITAWPWSENGPAKLVHKGSIRTDTSVEWIVIQWILRLRKMYACLNSRQV